MNRLLRRCRSLSLISAALLSSVWLTACGGSSGTAAPAPTPTFTIAASPTANTVFVGDSGNYTVTLKSVNGFNSSVALTVAGLPVGAVGSFSQPTVTPTSAGAASVLTVGTTVSGASATPAGSSSIEVTATGGGVTLHQTLRLVVQAPGSLNGAIQ